MLQLFPEDGGVGLAEAVDALLQVPHQEKVAAVRGGQAGVKGVLQGVGVLVFVHHHRAVARPYPLAEGRGRAVGPPQQPEGQVLEVAELQQLALPLAGGKAGVEVPHRPEQSRQPRGGQGPVLFGLRFAAGDQVQNLPEQPCRLGGAGPDGGFPCPGQPGFHPLEAGLRLHPQHIGGQQVVEGSPGPAGGQGLHPAQQGQGLVQALQRLGKLVLHLVGGGRPGRGGLAALLGPDPLLGQVGLAVGQGAFQQAAGRPGPPGRLLQQQGPPGGRPKAARLLPGGQHPVHRLAVIGQRAEKIVDLQHGPARRVVAAALAVQVGKGAEVGVLAGGLQGVGQGGLPQHLDAAGVGGGKVGRDVQLFKMAPEQVEAEGVDGADGGPLQQHPLAAQPPVGRVGLAQAEQALPDAGPQLGGGGVGKGDDEQPVGVHRAGRVGDEADGPLGQHGGLAAAGGRADQQPAAPVLDGGPLGRGPVGHGSSSFSSSVSSKGRAGARSLTRRSPLPASWQQIKP